MSQETKCIMASAVLLVNILGLNAQYYFIKRESPVPSSPIVDSNYPVYTFSEAPKTPSNVNRNDANQQMNQLSPPAGLFIPDFLPTASIQKFQTPTTRNDVNQQRMQLSPPAGLFNPEAYPSTNEYYQIKAPSSEFERVPVSDITTPAEEYGPPLSLLSPSVSKISPEDGLIFVPAFPGSSRPEGGLAAPAGNTGFIPPDGALLSPPAPVIDGKPLPSPRKNLEFPYPK